jgi:ABC-type proline/glycine betaine transport system substrate-binding protein
MKYIYKTILTTVIAVSAPLSSAAWAENVMMAKGANKPKDIEAHADGWIKAHQEQFDAWIETAKQAAM